jgi:hypothetical protein
MPGSAQGLQLTDTYRAQLLDLRQRTTALAAHGFLALPLSALDQGYGLWLRQTVGAVEEAKREGVAASDAYLARFVAAELATDPRPRRLDAEPYMGTEDGRSLAAALLPPLFTVKAALRAGRSDALRIGMVRATRIVGEEVLAAPRRALGDLMRADSRVRGWKRAIGANPCGACLALADGTTLDPGERLRRHGHCRCVAEPVVRGVPERYRRPTGREHFDSLPRDAQAALFHGRGGEEKADLIRTGAVPLSALVTRNRQAVAPDHFTETPMGALRDRANRPH